jgi:FtsZ-interacting cell division protein ZipA
MEPFPNDILTILVIICISWTGITFIGVLIIGIVFIYLSWSNRRRSKSIKPIPSQSRMSSVSIPSSSPSIVPTPKKTPVKNVDHHKKLELQKHRHDAISVIDEHSNSSYYSRNKYQKDDYRHDENDETTRINRTQAYGPRYQQRQPPTVKPLVDVRVNSRRTPYPPDVIARAKLMNNSLLPMDDKYL